MGSDSGVRIRDLVNPEKKMSKSTESEKSKILLSDEPKVAAKKIMSATTDSFEDIEFDFETRPGISNLIQILALVNNIPVSEVLEVWQGNARNGDYKKAVAESVENLLTSFQERITKISDDDILSLFPDGEKYANDVANAKLQEVFEKVGLR